MWSGGEQRNGRHDHSWRAETALQRFMLQERFLYRMQAPVVLESFNRGNGAALKERGLRLARLDRLPVDENRAGAALTFAAAVLRAGEIQRVAKHGEQRLVGCDVSLMNCAVHLQSDLHLSILPSPGADALGTPLQIKPPARSCPARRA